MRAKRTVWSCLSLVWLAQRGQAQAWGMLPGDAGPLQAPGPGSLLRLDEERFHVGPGGFLGLGRK